MIGQTTSQLVKKCLLALPLVGVGLPAAAQSVLAVAPTFFHLDTAKKLILINAPLARVNAAFDTLKVIDAADHHYRLSQPVTSVTTRQAYQVQGADTVYTVYFTQVPVLHLTTRHQIADTPSVYARLALADTSGVLAETATGIEIRGGSSQSYPKKSYELSLWADSTGATSRDISLLGLRNDNKWNLQALYNDPLRLRLKLGNELWMSMNQVYYQAQEPAAKSGIGLAYTEVFLNGSYQGIYTLTERVDRKQLKLKKYVKNSIMGELYKGTDNNKTALTYYGTVSFQNESLAWGGFEYKEPSEQIDWTNLYDFVYFVVNSSDADFRSQYKSQFNFENAVDYFIFLNVVRAGDNTGKNIYVAKYKPGEPYFYVPWDLDGILGNDWTGLNTNMTEGLLTNGFYDRLLKDTDFRTALSSRWATLRTSVLTQDSIVAGIERNVNYLQANSVYEREHLAWSTYAYDPAQLAYPATWLTGRLAYLDAAFAPVQPLAAAPAAGAALFQLYPNPASGSLTVAFGTAPYQLSIQSLTGETLLRKNLPSGSSQVDVSALPQGLYVVRASNAAATVVQKLVVR